MRKSKLLLVSLTVIASLLLAACGGAGTQAPAGEAQSEQASEGEKVTLKVLVHQNPPMVEFMNTFNEQFQANNPDITVDMSVVNANDLSTVTQTRLNANDVDVVDMFGFANAAQPYMKNVTPPNWQTLIDAGLLMDISDQPFVKNYDASAIADAGSYNDKVYGINLGRVSYSGIYYNKDLFAANNVEVPTTWDELVAACATFAEANVPCMTAGGKDGWPIFVGAYGLIGSIYPDQAGLVEGLWTGDITWNDAKVAGDVGEDESLFPRDDGKWRQRNCRRCGAWALCFRRCRHVPRRHLVRCRHRGGRARFRVGIHSFPGQRQSRRQPVSVREIRSRVGRCCQYAPTKMPP